MKQYFKLVFYSLTFFLIIAIAFPQSSVYGQNLGIYEDIGGSTQTGTSNSSDNSFIYILGGAVIAGILVYALFINKDKKEESDTSAALGSPQLVLSEQIKNDLNTQLSKTKELFPVELYLGVQRENAFISDKKYLVGISLKF